MLPSFKYIALAQVVDAQGMMKRFLECFWLLNWHYLKIGSNLVYAI